MGANAFWSGRPADLSQGTYSDGSPLDEIRYLECKLILKPNRFTCVRDFRDYGAIVHRAASECDVGFSSKHTLQLRPRIREVLFLDTADFRFYNNAFILRRRIPYNDGFPVGDPEIVFKFRHPDIQTTAQTDVRPQIFGDYRIKFKAEALPLKDQLGGMRILFSHNVQFPSTHVHENDRLSMDTITRVFPVLGGLKKSPGEHVEIVGDTIVEEVLQDVGILDFGDGTSATANVALWRARGDHLPLIGEFAYELKFKRRQDLREKALRRAEAFFVALQDAAQDWIALGATKTGVVYRLKGSPPHAHE